MILYQYFEVFENSLNSNLFKCLLTVKNETNWHFLTNFQAVYFFLERSYSLKIMH